MSKRRYLPEAFGFQRLAGRVELAGGLSSKRSAYSRHAVIASVLALYPSTTTEIPFT